ncbi:unnamed protein product [Phaedon cochleariae]|uniref:C2H2-type domain-containing protein n=1 Tax=Phaedon cochleariae TaxID=80249 RepID=A0A9N9SJU3_PHACE|nr:unnamed protein product [Phaedon cochleariae]
MYNKRKLPIRKNQKKSCKICKKNFTQKIYLINHVRTHNNEEYQIPLECEECQKTFVYITNLNDHMNEEHGIKNPFECDVCQKRFKFLCTLTQHYAVHTGIKAFQCDICFTKFGFKSNLYSHVKVHHSSERDFECDICHKTIHSKGGFARHLRLHTGERPFECQICQKTFTTNGNLTLHERIHTGEKPFKCSICNSRFGNSSHLKRHLRVHTGEKPFECDVCQKTFTTKRSSRLHRERCHKLKRDVECASNDEVKVEGGCELEDIERSHTLESPFQCKICQKTFTTNGSLTEHKRIHTGEKPFKCTICKSRFVSSSHLKRHIRVHTGEKPFKCDVCQKTFTNKRGCRLHSEKCHKLKRDVECASNEEGFEENPFGCVKCPERFATKDDLIKHSGIHRDKKTFKCDDAKKFSKQHQRMLKKNELFQCDICLEQFPTNRRMINHKEVHSVPVETIKNECNEVTVEDDCEPEDMETIIIKMEYEESDWSPVDFSQ